MGARSVARVEVRPHLYLDSVLLLQLSRRLAELPGIESAAVVLATPLNRELLEQAGLLIGTAAEAGPNDLVIALRASGEAQADAALGFAREQLAVRPASQGDDVAAQPPPRTVASAARRLGGMANLAVVSVPGPYAAGEAWQALRAGLHVFLFSDNVSLADEMALKRWARPRGLLVMGPDCGTAILNGAGLGFANVVCRGRVGLVGASGSGMQEVSVLLDRRGESVSQAIGTGGRDLSPEVGGSTTLQALELLRDDSDTRVIVLLSKPASADVGRAVLAAAAATGKPVVACLLGAELAAPPGVRLAQTLEQAAHLALEALEVRAPEPPPFPRVPRPGRGQDQVRGLYCGGTLCDEARLLVGPGPHRFVDFGDDRYTRGRAHPMIDPSQRNRALLEAADDPTVAVVLLDVILGYGAAPDPAAELAPLVARTIHAAADAGRRLAVFARVVGTPRDPQRLDLTEATLREAGAHLFPSNAAMARAARHLVGAAG